MQPDVEARGRSITPAHLPLSTSAFFTQSRSVCGVQPILAAIDTRSLSKVTDARPPPPSQELMEWMPLPAALGCEMIKVRGLTALGEDNMNAVTIIGVDLAKRVFHAHGSHSDGSVAFRKRLSRSQVLTFFAKQPRCTVAMEACATAHEWGRAIGELGHEIRLIPPAYVKPFVKRQKNDTSDAEAIAEAASRPTMRFVAVKTEEQQARSMIFRTRDLFVRQRTQLINALRGHLAEHGVIAPNGPANVRLLAAALNDADRSLQSLVRDIGAVYLEQISILNVKIGDLEKVLRREAQRGADTSRLQTMPGIGPITAMAIETFAPPMKTFKRGRDELWAEVGDGIRR
jgi:transposase